MSTSRRLRVAILAVAAVSLATSARSGTLNELLPEPRNGALLPPGRLVLTYDDGPGRNSLAIAEYLASRSVPATFFVNGCRFESMPPPIAWHGVDTTCASIVSRSFLDSLIALGHRVGNHTQDHPYLPELLDETDAQTVQQQVRATHDLLTTIVPDRLHVFRPPQLGWNPALADVINAAVPELIGPFDYDVNASPLNDWACLDTFSGEYCALQTLNAIAAGDDRGIILLHDRDLPSEYQPGADGEKTLRLTEALVDGLIDEGHVIVPLDAIPGVLGPLRFGDGCTGICVLPVPWTTHYSDAHGWDAAASYYRSIRLPDIDGDGDADVCGRSATGIWCMRSDGERFVEAKTWSSSYGNAGGWSPDRYGTTIQFGDLDGDGDDDVCGRGSDGLWCARSSGAQGGDAFGSPTLWSSGDDFSDADGWGASASYYGSFRLADVDGDGRADACARGSWGVGCALSNGSNAFGPMTVWIDSDFSNALGWFPDAYGTTLMFADLNGDGRADLCGRGIQGIHCALSWPRADVFLPSSLWIAGRYSNRDAWSTSAGKYGALRLADVNGDDLADVCGRNDTGVVCAFSDGARFTGYLHLNHRLADRNGWGPDAYGTTLQLGDLDHDGLADLCARGAEGIWCFKAAEALRGHLSVPEPGVGASLVIGSAFVSALRARRTSTARS